MDGTAIEKFYSEITLCCKLLKTQGKFRGWEAGIRTPIGGFRVRSLTVRRPPNEGISIYVQTF